MLRSLILVVVVALLFSFSAKPPLAHAQNSCAVDMILVLDTEADIEPADFADLKAVLRDLLSRMGISEGGAQLGLVQFGDRASLAQPLSADEDALLAALDALQTGGEGATLAEAINTAQTELAAGRADAPKLMFIITDDPVADQEAAIEAGQAARDAGTLMLGAIIGGFNPASILGVLGGNANGFTVASFSSLSLLRDVFLSQICSLDPNFVPGDLVEALAPPQARIAFSSNRDGDTEIYFINEDGSGLQQVTDNSANDDNPSWHPDGQQIAFESDLNGDYDIYIINADGSNLRQLTNNDADDFGPVISPDGTQIAYHSAETGTFDIYIMNIDGTNLRRITTAESAIDRSASWSPDGTRLVYFSDATGGREIYVVDIASGESTQLTYNVFYDGQPDWSPAGGIIAFSTTQVANEPDIFLMDSSGGNAQRLTSDVATDDDPNFSPDGQFIAFESTRTGNYDIWIIPAGGGEARQLTTDPGRDWSADWGPVPN